MPATKQKPNATVNVNFDKHARGYIGPCSHAECPQPATRIYDVHINDVSMIAWVCDTHGDDLEAIHRP